MIFTDLNIDVAASVSTYCCFIVQLSTTDEKTFNYVMSCFFNFVVQKNINYVNLYDSILEIQTDHFSMFL